MTAISSNAERFRTAVALAEPFSPMEESMLSSFIDDGSEESYFKGTEASRREDASIARGVRFITVLLDGRPTAQLAIVNVVRRRLFGLKKDRLIAVFERPSLPGQKPNDAQWELLYSKPDLWKARSFCAFYAEQLRRTMGEGDCPEDSRGKDALQGRQLGKVAPRSDRQQQAA